MTLEEHAAAIEAAMKAAAADGFFISNDGEEEPVWFLDLNRYGPEGRLVTYVPMSTRDDYSA